MRTYPGAVIAACVLLVLAGCSRVHPGPLADFLSLCQEICPLTSATFAQLAAAVDGAGLSNQVEFTELTVGPARDSPARLAAYQKPFSAKPDWALSTGSAAAVAAIWKQFGVDCERTPVPQPAVPGSTRRYQAVPGSTTQYQENGRLPGMKLFIAWTGQVPGPSVGAGRVADRHARRALRLAIDEFGGVT